MAETEESEKTFPRDGSGATWGSPAEAVQGWIRRVRNRFQNGRSDSDSDAEE